MKSHVLLDNITHKNVKIITKRSEKYGDNLSFAMIFPLEFRSVQAHYPIFFRKDVKTGQFYSVAMFGFEERENLFLTEKGWDAAYVPLSIQRQPFLIGFQNVNEDGVVGQQSVVHIDMSNPRVNEVEGEPVFMPHGGYSPYLKNIASVLELSHHGYENGKIFTNLLSEFDLLEQFSLEVRLKNGSANKLLGFYTINEEKLHQLDGEALARLNENQVLQAIYMTVASLSNIGSLIARKNALL